MSEEKTPNAKLSFEHWGCEASIKLNHSDISISDFYELCERLALAAGYHPSNVEEFFGECDCHDEEYDVPKNVINNVCMKGGTHKTKTDSKGRIWCEKCERFIH
jgi:hypothetical protein